QRELGRPARVAIAPEVIAAVRDSVLAAGEIVMPQDAGEFGQCHHTDLGLIEIPTSAEAMPRIIISEEEELVQTGVPCEAGCTYPAEAAVVVSAIEPPDTMPYVDDEIDEDVPGTMPYVGDDEEAAREEPLFIQRILQRIIRSAEQKFGCEETELDISFSSMPGECTPCTNGDCEPCEESEAEEAEEQEGDNPSNDDDSNCHGQHCPGSSCPSSNVIVCPYSGRAYPRDEVMPPSQSEKKKDVDSMEFRPEDANPQSFPQ
ncbi:MAG: hypothetical protein AB7K24_34045, partial [Gemmataceae bacterium]